MSDYSLRIAGEAGQGLQTIGMALCSYIREKGLFLFAHQDYMSRIRGGNNYFQIRISDQPVYTLREQVDILIALNNESVACHKNAVSQKGIIVADIKEEQVSSNLMVISYEDIMKTAGVGKQYISSAALAAALYLINASEQDCLELIRETFSDKSEEIITKNSTVAQTAYTYIQNNGVVYETALTLKQQEIQERMLINGNEAIALGAIKAGCKFYAAYPMTPATSIMNTMCHYAQDHNIVVEQAEDEIAAVNMIIGASYAGVRSMTGTSGGGFALMTEGLSLAAMTETPIVIVDSQRPGPATGLPTRTEQSDLEFLLHAGHGDFVRAVYTPGTIEQAFFCTITAFDVAEKFQIPAIIMTDQHLADSYRAIDPFDETSIKVKQWIVSKDESKAITNYKRYAYTESGVSPRAIPSWIADVVYVDSDEHTEYGHITESADVRNLMMEKRYFKRLALVSQKIEKPTVENIEKAQCILIGYGSTYGVLSEIAQMTELKVGMIHLSQVWPFPAQTLLDLIKDKEHVYTVENNAASQLYRLIRRETGRTIDGSILRYDGAPFNIDYLLDKVKGLL